MHRLFVPYGVALELRKHGFDEPCFLVYQDKQLLSIVNLPKGNVIENFSTVPIPTLRNSQLAQATVAVPLFQQVIDWFREKHRIHLSPFTFTGAKNAIWFDVEYMDKDECKTIACDKDYYKALINVILVLLKELK